MNHPPNGSRGKAIQGPMTPAERQLWMAKHQLPNGYTLLHISEVEAIGQGLQQEHRKRITLETEINAGITALDSYWTTEPDLANACAAAVFDANRFRIAMESARKRLEQTEAFLKLLLTESSIGPTLMIDLINEHAMVAGALQFIKEQTEARRERSKPA